MSSSVRYKLGAAAKEQERVHFEGTSIKLLDFKRILVQKMGFDHSKDDFDLVVSDAKSGEVFARDSHPLERNSFLTVRRVPMPGKRALLARLKNKSNSTTVHTDGGGSNGSNDATGTKNEDDFGDDVYADSNAVAAVKREAPSTSTLDVMSDIEKIQAVAADAARFQAVQGKAVGANKGRFVSKSYVSKHRSTKSSGLYTGSTVVASNNPGNTAAQAAKHQQRMKPVGADEMKELHPGFVQRKKRGNAGIPKVMLSSTAESLTSRAADVREEKRFVVDHEDEDVETAETLKVRKFAADNDAFAKTVGKFVKHKTREVKKGSELVSASANDAHLPKPGKHLLCSVSGELLNEAVMLPCCYRSCSKGKIAVALEQSKHVCPLCGTKNVTVDQCLPNVGLRESVAEFLETVETAKAALAAESGGAGDKPRLGWALPSDNVSDRTLRLGGGEASTTPTEDAAVGVVDRADEPQERRAPQDAEPLWGQSFTYASSGYGAPVAARGRREVSSRGRPDEKGYSADSYAKLYADSPIAPSSSSSRGDDVRSGGRSRRDRSISRRGDEGGRRYTRSRDRRRRGGRSRDRDRERHTRARSSDRRGGGGSRGGRGDAGGRGGERRRPRKRKGGRGGGGGGGGGGGNNNKKPLTSSSRR